MKGLKRAGMGLVLGGLAALTSGCGDGSTADEPGSSFEVVRSPKERLAATAPAEAVSALAATNAQFAFDLLRAADDGENLFYSPHSISIALAMTYAGAAGETKTEMASTLHFEGPDTELHGAFNGLDQALASRGQNASGSDGKPFRLKVANAAWAQRGFALEPGYLDVLAENYGSGVSTLDFMADLEGSRRTINGWVEERTEGGIPELLDERALSPLTRLVLTNAVYFNAAWAEPFDAQSTHDGAFTRLDGTEVTVPLMTGQSAQRYAQGSDYRAAELDYDGDEISMLLVVPDEGAFESFVSAFDAAKLAEIVGSLSESPAGVVLPRLDLRTKLALKETLSALGMATVFSDAADFSALSPEPGLSISDVIHEAFAKVNEAGTEAGAATAVVVVGRGAPTFTVEATRPFLFVIRDRATGAALFVGRVLDPSS